MGHGGYKGHIESAAESLFTECEEVAGPGHIGYTRSGVAI